jgi:type I restriction enzyme, S subunit
MSFPRYPSYKGSGVEWLGEVPEHWESIRYKNVFDEKNSIAGSSLPPGSISFGRVIFKDDEFLHEPTKASYQEVLSGEFLINPINLNYDLKSLRTALSEIDTCVSPAYIVLKAKVVSDKNYLKYQLHLFDLFHMKTLGAGVRQTITFDDIGACFTFIPPLSEQTKIVAVLDRETAKIDELVAEQQQLMKLLKEKRQVIISYAVTQGLNPDAPMKPSGIEWLGNVPKHWVSCSLRRYANFVDGDRGSEYPNENDLKDEGILFLSSKNIVGGRLNLTEAKFISHEKFAALNRGKALNGDLIVKVRGSTGRIGELAKFSVDEHGFVTAFINAQMMIIRTNHELLSNYLRFVSQSLYWTEQLSVGAYGTAQQQLSNDVFSNLRVAIPPVGEQEEIVNYLEIQDSQSKSLEAEAQRAIDLLQERRTALISAAVTGKIDVRGLYLEEAA